MNRIHAWLMREPEWWHFWHPSTGPAGGMVMGLLLAAVALVAYLIWGSFYD